jgi:hypothetical protein
MTENKTYKGYHLKKTGSRVNELLSRQFIVPTLDDVPTGNTLTWQDGEYVVEFRVGELCRVSVNNKWEFYRLHDISNGTAHWEKANASELPDMSDYYTKEETDRKIEDGVASIVLPEDESIRNVTEDEYNAMYEAESLSDKTMYFVSKDGSPVALYIGKIQIAVRDEGSKGFAYNFPIIF